MFGVFMRTGQAPSGSPVWLNQTPILVPPLADMKMNAGVICMRLFADNVVKAVVDTKLDEV